MMLKKKAGDGDINQHVFKEISRTVSLDAVRQLGVALDDNIGYLNGRVDFPILILRMDGEDLLDFIKDPSYESEMMTIFSRISIPQQFNGNEKLYVKDYFMEAVKQLTVDHGMPPSSDAFVMNNIIQPSLETYAKNVSGDSRGCVPDDNTTTFLLEEFEKFGHILVQHLKEEPIIVAHTQITFDGSKIKKLLTSKSNLLEKTLDMAVIEIQRDSESVLLLPCKEIFLVMFGHLGPLTGLPPYGAIHQIDKIVDEVFMKNKAEEEEEKMKIMENEDKVKYLKMLMRMLLEHIMLELEANKSISVSSNSVIHT
ncbi:hypothetical protein C5167_010337 [Papaver somniferum]|uniref:Uncharacterized protein n=1 Tax=Papaver somniferum TaxID=3469 RepID=A0A4Y7JZZ0_PAPSO|nr:uncharacterized protein LOC113288852 [Papaver somniferum]RZC66643.1 hypothetical protein C5167_010337 [Papaver somniferum]